MHDDHEAPRNEDGGVRSGRVETREERADRKWAELLQEVRVTQTGVQILFAFLLTVAFTPHFQSLGQVDRSIYVVTVLLGAAATGALIAPVSLHRIVTGRRLRNRKRWPGPPASPWPGWCCCCARWHRRCC